MANTGDTLESKSLEVTQNLINEYAHICGDYNTLHVDVEGMKDHPLFGGTIAHGTINVELVVKDKKTEGGKNILVCDMFVSNDKGTDCVKGTAEIVVPD